MPHNAAWANYAVGFREVVFLCKETTYGVIVHPAATDAIDFQTASFEFTQERVNRADKTTSRSYRERISHRKQTTWSITSYLLPSGVNGTAPDLDLAIEAALGAAKKVVPDHLTHAATACTTTVLSMVTAVAEDYAVGDAVGWVNAAGELEVTFVTSVTDGGAGADLLGISPPLSAAPGVGATIKGSVTYKLADTLPSLCWTRILDNMGDVWNGCFVNDASFDFPGTGEGTITIGGMGKTSFACGTSQLEGPMTDAQLTVPVPAGHGYRFEPNTRIQLDDEVLLITGITRNVALGTPGVATATPAAGGTMTAAEHFFEVAAVDSLGRVGTSNASFSGTCADANLSLVLAWAAVPGAAFYRIYFGAAANTFSAYKDVAALETPSYTILDESEFTNVINPPADASATQSPVYDTLAVTRAQAGTVAAAHTTATEFGPYQPARTVAGSPVSSTVGSFIIPQTGLTRAAATLLMQQMNIALNNQGSLRNTAYGTDSAIGFKVLRREVTFSTTLWLQKEQLAFYGKAKAFVNQPIMIQLGATLGRVVAGWLPTTEFNIPKIDGDGDEDISIPFTGMALGTVTGNDEFYFAFL